ncbi:MAG: hypothetical protein CSA62_00660 [Planctomycetota bacterium]|nr:MAG: hypothetical protein CSA62_00660 [Planctomycetota bacterium]
MVRPSPLALPLLALPLALLLGCGSTPEPEFRGPEIEEGRRYFAGSILSGRGARAELADKLDPAEALRIRCRVAFIEHLPELKLDRLASRARLILNAEGQDLLLPTGRISRGGFVARAAQAEELLQQIGELSESGSGLGGRRVPVFDKSAVLAPGITTAFFGQSQRSFLSEPGQVVHKRLALLVDGGRSIEEPAELALLLEDIGEAGMPEGLSQEMRYTLRQEIVVLSDKLEVDGPPIVLVVPAAASFGMGDAAWVAQLQLHRPPAGSRDFAADLEEARRMVREESRQSLRGSRPLARVEAQRYSMQEGLRSLDLARHHRPALVFLTSQGDRCPLAQDLALSGDTDTLAAWIQVVQASLKAQQAIAVPEEDPRRGAAKPSFVERARSEPSWTLERAAYQLLSKRLDRGEISEAMRGMLARHAGEAGCFPGAIPSLLEKAEDQQSFQELLITENLGFLNASQPASRIRAFDWLQRMGITVPGYEPLAERNARRKALRSFQAQRIQAQRSKEQASR